MNMKSDVETKFSIDWNKTKILTAIKANPNFAPLGLNELMHSIRYNW